MKRKLFWICAVAMGMSAFPSFMTQATPATQPLINAEPAVAAQTEQNPQVGQVMPGVQGADAPIVAQNGPSRDVKLTFAQIAPPPGSMVLRGINPNGSIEFGMRSDEVVTKAMLNLEYTPSPSLLPVQSQLKVYLNDELMGVLPVTKEQLGKKTLAQMPINPLFITDFNRVRLEFVGHYQDVCENPASTTLWLDVGRSSGLDLTYQTLNVKNDLSHFPVPFFDPRDNRTNTLPIVFAGAPDVGLQQASAIVASWFGSRSGWRGQNFPVLYNQLPDRNAIVFATNDKRPDFLRDHPAVKAPVIEMINHPQNPYVKLLVVFGRDDKDLLQAAKGIAQGNILFRGESVVVNEVKPLLPRKPYDAPNWVRTDRPVTFGELKTYEEQLQSSGLEPAAINVSLNLPPDLYLMRSTGIDMDINYRYTMPPVKDSSRMDISLNNQFLQSFNLSSKQEANRLLLRIPVLQGLLDGKTDVSIPALKLGATNQLRFDFEYMNPMPGGSVDNCITFQPVQNHVVIGDDSTIDFSKYYHFIPMPDLRAFANAGFPFSRMADLSQTITVMPKTPMRQTPFPGIVPDESDRAAETQSTLTSSGAMAAVIGFQSPYNDQRSVIALLADSPRGYEMLNDAVNDSGKRATMFGSVAVIRESGINSLRVGDVYYVGHLPWFERLWYALANHPILLAVLAAISVVLLAWVLWRLLRIISRRRLNPDNE
ncbi:cellulose biosynthesis cyclic di-GMP-binding regulatory protein BcsB [Escherichia coli]|uniref:cellulose biosynthesis cyclic di-GMP-binding regulatory protein BcsB n=1 Tax=Escherichia coli TaxID=562 RepID=UPI0028830FB6|nr:cellulose biosynthesis cyclic di-GMP-binding regulatory protein BcsB [Escherichia coli]